MQGKAVIIVVSLLVLLLIGLIVGIIYLVLSDRSDDGDRIDDSAIIADGDISENNEADGALNEDSNDESSETLNEEATHEDLREEIDLTGHPLIGSWKNTLEEIYNVDVSFMETTLEFRTNGVAIRESMNINFRYEWTLENDILYMKSFGAWGNTHNPENDKTYTLTWITTDSFSIDFYDNDEMVVFDRIS